MRDEIDSVGRAWKLKNLYSLSDLFNKQKIVLSLRNIRTEKQKPRQFAGAFGGVAFYAKRLIRIYNQL